MRTRIKICGLRDAATARQVALLGADAIGLVFYPPSPRHVSVALAAEIVAALPVFVASVGLFVNASVENVSAVLEKVPLDLLQFHGDEDLAFCSQFGRPFIKALRVKPGINLLEYAASFVSPLCRGILLDAWVDGVPGGTGESFDWQALPNEWPLPLILSGGLHPENVAAAIACVQPWAVDVSSGVEQCKGIKDLVLVESFVRAVI
ncbi:phosphoribosylanthranilate isomerase [Deefgea salmonis]|uniref:N-(5'-phosphoribosyl)anthranilate isomerase n=1 Tax=Deefgea salmonis TaxID=2875502 RepID=A0ABS8BHR5_9NEIS|nr:phosphoribosylanthranilate isomerase [Deefgea salmonis]MCB5195233.1 phosphoribosylanthranilate isomerase [Deefgea salmonis]